MLAAESVREEPPLIGLRAEQLEITDSSCGSGLRSPGRGAVIGASQACTHRETVPQQNSTGWAMFICCPDPKQTSYVILLSHHAISKW